MTHPLDEIVQAQEQAKQYTLQMANTLKPLKNSVAFKAFLGTIQQDLDGFISDMEAVPFSVDASPKLFECRGLMSYARQLLVRVDGFINEAQAVQEPPAEGEESLE